MHDIKQNIPAMQKGTSGEAKQWACFASQHMLQAIGSNLLF